MDEMKELILDPGCRSPGVESMTELLDPEPK